MIGPREDKRQVRDFRPTADRSRYGMTWLLLIAALIVVGVLFLALVG